MDCPVVARRLGELTGAVEGVDDPDAVALEPSAVVLALLAEHHVVGTDLAQQAHQELVRRLVTGVLERATFESLLAHAQQQVAGLRRGPGGHLVVIGVRGERRTVKVLVCHPA